jgi:hypothetical protein
MEGDTQKDLALTQARAMVIREYMVENFGFDDSQLKTLGLGKQPGSNPDAGWGSIQILIFPPGVDAPPEQPHPAANSSATTLAPPAQVPVTATRQP